jgi:hypothetical protein
VAPVATWSPTTKPGVPVIWSNSPSFVFLSRSPLIAESFHVCLHLIDIEADCGSDFEHLCLVDLAARLIKRVMEDSVFALLIGRESCLAANAEPGQELETLCRRCAGSGRPPGFVPLGQSIKGS